MESEVKAEPVGESSEPTGDAAMKEVNKQPPLPTSASSQVIAPTSSLPGVPPPNITTTFREMLPKQGYLHCEDELTFVLCKPKLLPLKSFTMEKLEKIQAETVEKAKELMENSQLD